MGMAVIDVACAKAIYYRAVAGQDRDMASTMSESVPLAPRRRTGAQTEGDVLRSLVDALIAEDLFGFRSRGRIGSVAGALYLPLEGDERHVQVGLGSDAVVFRARPAAALQPYRLSRPPVLLLGPDGGGPVPLTPAGAPRPRRRRASRRIRGAPERPAAQPRRGARRAGPGRDPRRGPAGVADGLWGRVRSPPVRLRSTGRRSPPWATGRSIPPAGPATAGTGRAYRRYSPAADAPVALDWVAVRARPSRLRQRRTAGRVRWPWRRARRPVPERRSDRRSAPVCPIAEPVARPTRCCRPATGRPWRRPSPRPGSTAPDSRRPAGASLAARACPPRPLRRRVAQRRVRAGRHRVSVRSGRRRRPGRWCRPGADRRRRRCTSSFPSASPRSARCGCCRPATWPTPPGPSALLEAAPPGATRRSPGRLHACDEQALVGLRTPGTEPAAGYDDKPGHLGCLLRVWPDERRAGPRPEPRAARRARRRTPPTARRPVWPASSPTGATTPPSPAAALAVFDDVARVVSEVALACFGLGFMPELHGQNAVLACERGRVAGIVLRDHDTVRLHRPWLADAGAARSRLRREARHPQQPVGRRPEELLGWFQTLAVEVSLRAIGRALSDAYGVDEETVWRRLADVVRAARSGVDLPPAGRRGDRPAAVPRRRLADEARARPAAGPASAPEAEACRAAPAGPATRSWPATTEPPNWPGTPRPSASSTASCGSRASSRCMVGSTVTIPFARSRPGRRRLAGLPVRRWAITVSAPASRSRDRRTPIGATPSSPSLVGGRTGGPATPRRHARRSVLCAGRRQRRQDAGSSSSACRSPGPSTRGTPRTRSWPPSRACAFGHPFHPAPKASVGFDRRRRRALRPRARRVVPAALAGGRPRAAGRGPAAHRPVARSAAGAVRRGRRPRSAARGPPGRCCPAIPGRRSTWPRLAGGGRADRRRSAGGPRAARPRRCTPPPRSARCGTRRPAGS